MPSCTMDVTRLSNAELSRALAVPRSTIASWRKRDGFCRQRTPAEFLNWVRLNCSIGTARKLPEDAVERLGAAMTLAAPEKGKTFQIPDKVTEAIDNDCLDANIHLWISGLPEPWKRRFEVWNERRLHAAEDGWLLSLLATEKFEEFSEYFQCDDYPSGVDMHLFAEFTETYRLMDGLTDEEIPGSQGDLQRLS